MQGSDVLMTTTLDGDLAQASQRTVTPIPSVAKEIPMKLNKTVATMTALALAALLAGCASSVKLDEPAPVENRSGTPVAGSSGQPAGGGKTTATPQTQVATVDLSKQPAATSSLAGPVVYFDFDSFVVKDEFRGLIDAHARCWRRSAASAC
jgi:peptidoglycan-associated lipoprotein